LYTTKRKIHTGGFLAGPFLLEELAAHPEWSFQGSRQGRWNIYGLFFRMKCYAACIAKTRCGCCYELVVVLVLAAPDIGAGNDF
jgi:hypothetical protein